MLYVSYDSKITLGKRQTTEQNQLLSEAQQWYLSFRVTQALCWEALDWTPLKSSLEQNLLFISFLTGLNVVV